jgi:hypothetical protein
VETWTGCRLEPHPLGVNEPSSWREPAIAAGRVFRHGIAELTSLPVALGAVAVLVLLIGPLTLVAGTFRRRELSSEESAANQGRGTAIQRTRG